jgi:hypothetical protein
VKSTRKPCGEPIKGDFPASVSEANFYLAQQALDGRPKGGRISGTPNLFGGCLWDATGGNHPVLNGSHGHPALMSAGAVRKATGFVFRVVRYEPFKRIIPWPRCSPLDRPQGHPTLLVNEALAGAICRESAAALCYYWNVSGGSWGAGGAPSG